MLTCANFRESDEGSELTGTYSTLWNNSQNILFWLRRLERRRVD
jgi:hypothetical protein